MAVRKASKSLPESELALRAIAMPVFANAHGDIFGGWLLSKILKVGRTFRLKDALAVLGVSEDKVTIC